MTKTYEKDELFYSSLNDDLYSGQITEIEYFDINSDPNITVEQKLSKSPVKNEDRTVYRKKIINIKNGIKEGIEEYVIEDIDPPWNRTLMKKIFYTTKSNNGLIETFSYPPEGQVLKLNKKPGEKNPVPYGIYEKDGLIFSILNDNLYSGQITEIKYFDIQRDPNLTDGQKFSKSPLKPEDRTVFKKSIINYKNGIKEDYEEYNYLGEIDERGKYKNGFIERIETFENGKIYWA